MEGSSWVLAHIEQYRARKKQLSFTVGSVGRIKKIRHINTASYNAIIQGSQYFAPIFKVRMFVEKANECRKGESYGGH